MVENVLNVEVMKIWNMTTLSHLRRVEVLRQGISNYYVRNAIGKKEIISRLTEQSNKAMYETK